MDTFWEWYIDKPWKLKNSLKYSETLNNEYIERIHQMSYSSLSDNGMLQIFSFLIKCLKLFPHIHGYLFIFANTEIYVI